MIADVVGHSLGGDARRRAADVYSVAKYPRCSLRGRAWGARAAARTVARAQSNSAGGRSGLAAVSGAAVAE